MITSSKSFYHKNSKKESAFSKHFQLSFISKHIYCIESLIDGTEQHSTYIVLVYITPFNYIYYILKILYLFLLQS